MEDTDEVLFNRITKQFQHGLDVATRPGSKKLFKSLLDSAYELQKLGYLYIATGYGGSVFKRIGEPKIIKITSSIKSIQKEISIYIDLINRIHETNITPTSPLLEYFIDRHPGITPKTIDNFLHNASELPPQVMEQMNTISGDDFSMGGYVVMEDLGLSFLDYIYPTFSFKHFDKLPYGKLDYYEEHNRLMDLNTFKSYILPLIRLIRKITQLHRIGIAHGDIKFNNMIYRDGTFYLFDYDNSIATTDLDNTTFIQKCDTDIKMSCYSMLILIYYGFNNSYIYNAFYRERVSNNTNSIFYILENLATLDSNLAIEERKNIDSLLTSLEEFINSIAPPQTEEIETPERLLEMPNFVNGEKHLVFKQIPDDLQQGGKRKKRAKLSKRKYVKKTIKRRNRSGIKTVRKTIRKTIRKSTKK